MLTGTTGNGKSSACNFYMQKNFFKARRSLLSVTRKTESKVATVGGKRVELVDTPGFLDPSSVEEDDERLEFARGLIDIKCGFHMLGLVFNVTRRIEKADEKVLKNLLTRYKHYLPYIVLFFTRAKSLGDTEVEQKSVMKDLIEEIQATKISSLPQVLEKINHRYIILESVEEMGEGYHGKKSNELVKMIGTIFKQTGKPATNDFALSIAKNLKKVKIDHNDLKKELAERIKVVQEMMKDTSKHTEGSDKFYPYLKYAIINGGGLLAPLLPAPAGMGAAVAAGLVIHEKCTFQ